MVNYSSFEEEKFRRQVDKALLAVATILDTTRTPRYAEEEDHVYDDKYALAEFMANTAVASYVNVLERFGLDEKMLRELCRVVHEDKRSVTLRFATEDSCTFVKERDVTVPVGQVEVQVETTETSETTWFTSQKEKTTKTKISKKVKECHWKVAFEFKLFCFVGNEPDKDPMLLQSRSSSTRLITAGNSKEAPIPGKDVHPHLDVNLTWLLQQISPKTLECLFKIDRSHKDCKTPRRNEDMDKAFHFFREVDKWSARCYHHLRTQVEEKILNKHEPADATPSKTKTPSLRSVHADGVFCPILPLFETTSSESATTQDVEKTKSMVALASSTPGAAGPLLSVGDIDKFLNEEIRQLEQAIESLNKTFPLDEEKLVTAAEAKLVLLWHHSNYLSFALRSGVDYIEDMLRKQLIAAIGKEVQPKDFDDFVRFHGKKLFGPTYAPKPFCYAIRRPQHYPDGVLSIEAKSDKMDPIEATVNSIEDGPSMFIPINAATSVEITGQRYLHGWIQHRFNASPKEQSTAPQRSFNLVARARQFSSFLLIVGTISGPTEFTPKDAIILQNKDEVIIPLLLNELPTAKEFKDAISSLSPEQQRFAKSFRGMQLESSVFGVCVVQLKPQLEVLLGLPPDALTKEIRLTQDLLSLFIDYQIPSDLLSFDGAPDAPVADKVTAVKEHVQAVQAVIDDAMKKQLEHAEKKAEMNVYRTFGEMREEEADFAAAAVPAALEGSLGSPEVMFDAPRRMQMAAPKMAAMSAAMAPMSASAVKDARGPSPRMRRATHQLQQQAPRPPPMEPPLVSDEAAPGGKPFTGAEDVGRLDLLASTPPAAPGTVDFTAIPKQLDAKFDVHDEDSALRATIIKADKHWKRKRQENLLTKAREAMLSPAEIKSEKDKAFDLLDALSRSGALPIACAELHVVVAVTHCFEKDVMGTVIKDNVNPIEKVEKTMLLMASTIHGVEPMTLIEDQAHSARLTHSFPALFAPAES